MRVVAFGGGHGLSASLRALKRLRADLDLDLTAVVTVADDGGSSGRLRAERGGLPPGDLRQALAALASEHDAEHNAEHNAERDAERDARIPVDLWQYRFPGDGSLGGHAIGNVLLAGLMELHGDPVVALDLARDLVHAVGRVLPMCVQPLNIEATIRGDDPIAPQSVTTVRGQHAIAVSTGDVLDVRLSPDHPEACPEACPEAIEAVQSADWLIFGPGSWFTSVIPHLLVPDLATAISASRARRLVTLNLAVELETAGLSLPDHLRALARYLPGLRVDVVLADGKAVGDPMGLQSAAESLGARVVLAPVAVADGSPRHDPVALASALHEVLTEPVPTGRAARPAHAATAPEDGPQGPDGNAR